MLYFSPSKNCTKNVSARTLRLPTEALHRLLLSHITRAIRLTPFAQIPPLAELRVSAKRYQTVPKKDKKEGRENLKTEKMFICKKSLLTITRL